MNAGQDRAVRRSDPEVYPEREDTELLRAFARARRGDWLLDLGTGNGALALAAARRGAGVVATDRNPAALRRLARAARAEGLRLLPVRTDLGRGIRPVDRLLSNPPYLPTPSGGEDPDPWVDLALNGGPDGCRVHARIVAGLFRSLRPGGTAFVLESSLQSPTRRERLRAGFRRRGGRVRRVAERALEGERLEIWEWRTPKPHPTGAARRTGRRPRGTAARPPAPPPRRRGSSRGPAPGRTSAPGGASVRRRSPRGS